MEYDFKDIRPYRDHEVASVLKRLRANSEFVSGLRYFFLPNCPAWLIKPANIMVSLVLYKKLRNIKTIEDFQKKIMTKYGLDKIVENSVDEMTRSGMEVVSLTGPQIFISNHRDIALDSSLMNYHFLSLGIPYTENAIGDNLLMNGFVTDLFRINKGFIVKRGLPIREQIKASYKLSHYIWHTLSSNKKLWLAQREGRAKNGDDRTNPSVIKMLHLSQRKGGLEFNDFIKACFITPIAISYEFDPCDRMKARELYRREKNKEYRKRKSEDFISTLVGIKRPKGRIHVSFGKPLDGEYKNAKEVAEAIDRSIHLNYKFWPSNYAAFDIVHKTDKYKSMYDRTYVDNFLKRFERLPGDIKLIALKAYSKPLENFNTLTESKK